MEVAGSVGVPGADYFYGLATFLENFMNRQSRMQRRIIQARRYLLIRWPLGALLIGAWLLVLQNLLNWIRGQSRWMVILFSACSILSIVFVGLLPLRFCKMAARRFNLICPSCGRELLDITLKQFNNNPTCPRCQEPLSRK